MIDGIFSLFGGLKHILDQFFQTKSFQTFAMFSNPSKSNFLDFLHISKEKFFFVLETGREFKPSARKNHQHFFSKFFFCFRENLIFKESKIFLRSVSTLSKSKKSL